MVLSPWESAWRYGFMPEESPISITGQEFEEARRLGKPCFCFVVDETFEWPTEYKEEGQGAEQLNAFKARIDAELVRTTFTNPDHLSRQVLSSLNRWEKGQHRLTLDAATALLSGPESIDDAKQMVADVLTQNEIEYTLRRALGLVRGGVRHHGARHRGVHP